MRPIIAALALAAFALPPAAAHAAIISFSGTFPEFIPTTQFSRAGAGFTVRVDTPLTVRDEDRGIRRFDASITFDGIERASSAALVASVIPSGPNAGLNALRIGFQPGGFFATRGTGFALLGVDFYRQVTPRRGRFRTGSFDLRSGTVSVFNGLQLFSNPVLNLGDLRIGAGSLATSGGFASFAVADASVPGERLFADQIAVPSASTLGLFAGGLGLMGLAFSWRRRPPAA